MGPLIAAIALAALALTVAVIALRRVGPALPPPPTDEEREQARSDLVRMRGERP